MPAPTLVALGVAVTGEKPEYWAENPGLGTPGVHISVAFTLFSGSHR